MDRCNVCGTKIPKKKAITMTYSVYFSPKSGMVGTARFCGPTCLVEFWRQRMAHMFGKASHA